MATKVAKILNSSDLWRRDVGNILDGALYKTGTDKYRFRSVNNNSVRSTATSTPAAMSNTSIDLDVEEGDVLLLLAHITWSKNDTNGEVGFQFAEEGSIYTGIEVGDSVDILDGSGRSFGCAIVQTDVTPTVGQTTYEIYWQVDAGTAYVRRTRVVGILFKNE
jgi:hypothetical protein